MCARIRTGAVGWQAGRFRRRLRCRRNDIRIDRAQRLLINFAGHFQAIANLITPNCRSRLGTLVARDGAVVKPPVFKSLLQGSNRLVGAQQADGAQCNDQTKQRSFHYARANIRLAMDSCAHVRVRVFAQLVSYSTSPARCNSSVFQNRHRVQCPRDAHFYRKRSPAESSEC